MKPKPWLWSEAEDNHWHQMPLGDLIEHEIGMDCPCGPIVTEIIDGNTHIAHFSLDNREGFVPDERRDIDKGAGDSK